MLQEQFDKMGREMRRDLKRLANEIPWEYRLALVASILAVLLLSKWV